MVHSQKHLQKILRQRDRTSKIHLAFEKQKNQLRHKMEHPSPHRGN